MAAFSVRLYVLYDLKQSLNGLFVSCGIVPFTYLYSAYHSVLHMNTLAIYAVHRRINTEGKAKVVASMFGGKKFSIPCRAIAVLPMMKLH